MDDTQNDHDGLGGAESDIATLRMIDPAEAPDLAERLAGQLSEQLDAAAAVPEQPLASFETE